MPTDLSESTMNESPVVGHDSINFANPTELVPFIRPFHPADVQQVNALALRAFDQFSTSYADGPAFRAKVANMASLADTGEIIVAEFASQIVGAVAYLAPGIPKADFFRPEWPVMRMLVVTPEARGLGIGRALAEECLRRARRDCASVFALHTSELMQVALPMYRRMGFERIADAPAINGVEYAVYLKNLDH